MSDTVEPIAIIGLGARVPGARDVEEFWSNLRAGRESISFLTDEELLENGVPPEQLANRDYVKAVPLVPDVKQFDADLFGMTTREAEICDPAIRLFMEVAHAAIENAGYDPRQVGDGFGVFAASGPCDYQDLHLRQSLKYKSADIFQMSTLNNTDYAATLTAYKLDLRGPAMTIVTACSSSLVALHVACQSLRYGECDAAVVGGANVEMPYGYGHMWVPGAVRSADGHCRPFDAEATGTMFGSGSATVVLKRLSDAVRDRDPVRALVLGSAINNDGSDKVSFSAPSINGQVAVIMEAMAMAGCQPSDISYVEAHGTATALGDPIEVTALAEAYRRLAGADLPPGSIGLGSVKSNIGHLVWAAGVSQVVKVALALDHEEMPPTVNFTRPNPNLNLERTPLFINDRLREWPRVEGAPRRVGISSLGIGGTNAHVVLEEAPVRIATPVAERPRIVVWSGRSRDAINTGRDRLVDYLRGENGGRFTDAVATLQRGRSLHRVRAATVGSSAAEVAEALAAGQFAVGPEDKAAARPVAFLFPGQGSQFARMATELYETTPQFARLVDECLTRFEANGLPLTDAWHSAEPDALVDTRLAQPMLFTIEYALARLLQHWGLRPAALLGHSIGELTAAAVADVFTLDDAVRVIAARAQAMGDAPRGAMLSVPAPAAEVETMITGALNGARNGSHPATVNGSHPDTQNGQHGWSTLVVSVRNTANRAVVGGPLDEVAAFEADLVAKGLDARRLSTSHAFHSPMMADAAQAFHAVLREVELRPPTIAIISAATGRPISDDEATDPAFWSEQVVQPVRFDLALDTLLSEPRTLLEVGPGHVLAGLARQHGRVREKSSVALTSLDRGDGDTPTESARIFDALARVWVEGHDLDWSAVDNDDAWQRVVVPGYPYQRKQHWVVPTSGPSAPKRAESEIEPLPSEAPRALDGPDGAAGSVDLDAAAGSTSPYATRTWVEVPAVATATLAGQTALALVPADRTEAMAVLGPLLRAGARVIRVRPGDSYAGGGDEFQVRPHRSADLEQVLSRLAADGRHLDLLVHAWATPVWEPPTSRTLDAQLDSSFGSLLSLIQHGSRRTGGTTPRLVVLASRLADVSGAEPVDPVKATLVGLAHTWAREEPGARPKIIDLGPGASDRALTAELADPAGPELIALRGHRRWVPDEQPLDLTPEHDAVRESGVYLITGGLGGLGLAAGKALARTGCRPRLMLAGRTDLPADAEQLAVHDPRLRHVLAEIEEMTEIGATVRTSACDIADARQVKRLLDTIAAQFGPLNGVLHLAGVPGDGLLQLRAREDAQAVLRPKLLGTVVLEECLRGRPPLDFLVSFSSRAALHGLVGSGDYAAANAALDAFAAVDGPYRRVSVNWPAWSGVGMAVDGARNVRAEQRLQLRLDPERDWVLDEHRLDGRAVMPGTGYLDLVLTSCRRLGLVSAEDAVQFEAVAFQNAMVVDSPREVEVVFTRLDSGWQFVVRSWAADAVPATPETAVSHVDGQIRSHARSDAHQAPTELYDGFLEVEPPSLKPAPGRLFSLGERWQNIARMWRCDAKRQLVVELALPNEEGTDVDGCEAHPALLDGATASVRDLSDGLHLPFFYHRAVFHRPFPSIVYSQVRRRPDSAGVIVADITVVAPDGTLLAEIDGYTMRKIDRPQFLDEAAPTEAAAEPAGGAQPVAAPLDRIDPEPVHGVDPDEGGQLLVRLLGSRTPSQVLIRPYAGGRPIPLPIRSGPLGAEPSDGSVAGEPSVALVTSEAAVTDGASSTDGMSSEESVQTAVAAMWQEALGIETLEPDDEFFDLGGDSLSSIQLMRRIRESFGVQLSVGVLFECPTVRTLSAEITRLAAA